MKIITKTIDLAMRSFLFCLFISFAFITAQAQENPYSTWAEKEIPNSYGNIKVMVEKVWGDDDDKRNAYMIELHCRSLNIMLTKMQSEEGNWDVLAAALEKWSLSKEEERGENWWEWPDTNWMKVESEYRIQLESKN